MFDHWFCEVPSQTFMNRSFWTAATSSGFVVNEPATKWLTHNNAETIFNRLEQHGKTWKVYVAEPMRFSATGLIHYPRLKDRFATHFVPFSQFEADAANGDLPDFSFIEPCTDPRHGDYHPAVSRALGHGVVIPSVDPPSSILGGEAFLSRIYNAYQGMQSSRRVPTSGTRPCSSAGTNRVAPTTTSRPARCRRPTRPHRPASSASRSTAPATGPRHHRLAVGGRGEVFNEEHRHTSLIATLREQWGLGDPFTGRDAAARTFSHAFTLDTPRDPETWPVPTHARCPSSSRMRWPWVRSCPSWAKPSFDGIRAYAEQNNIKIEGLPETPRLRSLPSRRCTSSITSSRSSSPCCTRPPRFGRRDLI